jgi:di/tricarboxylate transporter
LSTLGWDAWYTVAVAAGLVVALMRDLARPDLVMLGGLAALLTAGVVSPAEAFEGFSNSAVLTVAALYVVAAGVQRTDALVSLDAFLFGQTGGLGRTLARFMVPTSVLSGLLNNTPIVAMLIPRLQQWARRRGIPASKLMIPLSYAAITGGLLTLFGTSTNLIVAGLMESEGYEPLRLFDITWVGVPVTTGVVVYFATLGHRFLPDRGTLRTAVEDELQDDLFEMRVTPESPLRGETVSGAGLRDLGDAYLVHVQRGEQITEVTPRTVLEDGDLLAFTGDRRSLGPLSRRTGLAPHRTPGAPLPPDADRSGAAPVGEMDVHDDALSGILHNRRDGTPATFPDEARLERADFDGAQADDMETLPLYEAVVADSSDLVGKSLREVSFRERYGGVVLGIQRKNKPVHDTTAQVPLRAGDLLIVEAERDFVERWGGGGQEEFYLVAPRERQGVPEAQAVAEVEARDRRPESRPDAWRAPFSLALLGTMVLVAATGLVPIVTSAFVAALVMVFSGCLSAAEAQKALNIQVLVVIAAALGIGGAIEATGLAAVLGRGLVGLAADSGAIAVLVALYLATNLLTELVTNNAAAVLMLPIAMAAAAALGEPPIAFGVVVAVAASASFLTPIGYQTNLMVMAPGGYRFSDYTRAGWPVTLLTLVITVAVVALRWL